MDVATYKQGETIRLQAPANAASFRFWGRGANDEIAVADGEAVIPSARTGALRTGRYESEWRVVASNGDVSLPAGPVFDVVEGGLRQRDATMTTNERILEAARKALETAAESSETTIDVAGYSASFASRLELVEFVATMERRVARERGKPPVRMRRWL